MSRVCVVGATGFAGRELCRLLAAHPELHLAHAMRARADAPAEGAVEALDVDRFAEVSGVFLCVPAGAAAPLAVQALEAGARVVDLSADFRLRDPDLYAATYGAPHGAPELLAEAAYGLTEHARGSVDRARLVANPGCYPTAVLLPLLPLLAAQLLDPAATIAADAKSGVSGAGAAPTDVTHYANVHENFRAYGVGTHRHAPEIWQVAGTERIAFVPHLLPCFRGILATLYLTPAPGVTAGDVHEALAQAYADETFIHVLSDGTPSLADVTRTNMCQMAVAAVGPAVVVVSAIDNLVKGAAGQALQNMNRMLGLEEWQGLV